MKWYFYLLITIGVILLLLITLGFVIHSKVYGKSKVTKQILDRSLNHSYLKKYKDLVVSGMQWFEKIKKEDIYINSYDNLKLKGYFIANENNTNNKVIILAHGYHSFGFFDFSCSGKDYFDLGFNILVIEQRANESSEGKYTTFGIKERYDLLYWINYIDKRYSSNCEIVLGGISMGSSTVMYTLGLDLPKSVKCAICDCGYTSPIAVLKHMAKRILPYLSWLIVPFINLASICRTGVSLSSMNTKNTLPNAKIPVIIFHGDNDITVPVDMAKSNYSYINGEKEIFIVNGAQHGISYLVQNDKCKELVKAFLNKYLNH